MCESIHLKQINFDAVASLIILKEMVEQCQFFCEPAAGKCILGLPPVGTLNTCDKLLRLPAWGDKIQSF
jgi:hypothetical protein